MSAERRNIRAAVMGGSESGKTFFTGGLLRGQWKMHKRRGIVFDPYLREHPNFWNAAEFRTAWATDDFERFRRAVENTKGCAVVWDEGTMTGGRDRENVGLFTAIRHNHPALFFIGHRFDAMLPIMRGSLTDVFLAATHRDDAREWAATLTDDAIMEAAKPQDAGGLAQYEFLHKRAFRPIQRLRPSLRELAKGLPLG